jgi:hypothetical protein
MQGNATFNDKWSLYWELKGKSVEERKAIPFALFVGSLGMLNGEQAFQYLQEKFIDKI